MSVSVTGPVQVDVVILGGGVQGLWLLNDLHRKKYSAVLLERRHLGGGQTCHSHVYIHQGHLYEEESSGLAKRLPKVTGIWQTFLAGRTGGYTVMPSYFGYQNPADAQQKEALWQSLRLSYDQINRRPRPLVGGTIRCVLRSPEVCLDGGWLTRELERNVRKFISLVKSVTRIDTPTDRVTEVEAHMPGGVRLLLAPRAVVLAAGAGNQALLDLASGGRRALMERIAGAQQTRMSYMLVVRGRKGILNPLTGVFPRLGGLFLVSRDLGRDVVWLVSDYTSGPLTFPESYVDYDARWWLPAVLGALKQLSPRSFNRPEKLRWGLYAAPKAEGRSTGSIPHEERIEKFRIRNLWAVWPTKLTLAPMASRRLLSDLRAELGAPAPWNPAPQEWTAFREDAPVDIERWRRTPLVSWAAFRKCYYL